MIFYILQYYHNYYKGYSIKWFQLVIRTVSVLTPIVLSSIIFLIRSERLLSSFMISLISQKMNQMLLQGRRIVHSDNCATRKAVDLGIVLFMPIVRSLSFLIDTARFARMKAKRLFNLSKLPPRLSITSLRRTCFLLSTSTKNPMRSRR